MLARPLPLSFLDTYSISTSSLGGNALCMVISFLVLWSTCLSSSLLYFKKSPEYLKRNTALVFTRMTSFLLHSFVSSNFVVLLGYYLEFCLSFPFVWWCQPPRLPSICRFLFFRAFWSCLDLVVQFRQSDVVCGFLLLERHIYYAKFHSYVLTVYFIWMY